MKLYGLTFKNDDLKMVLIRSRYTVYMLNQILNYKTIDVGKLFKVCFEE